MVRAPPPDQDRFDGLAVFAAAAFALGLGLIAALERIGAPDGFVEALGPLLAFAGVCLIGAATRAANLQDFLAARRATPPLYGGLAFAATAAGLLMAVGATGSAPWLGLGLGLAAAALLCGPALRREGASAVADVLATRYPAAPVRIALTLALLAAGLLTAVAGFDLAVPILGGATGWSRRVAEALVAIALALSIAPGGLKGLLWSDAASGGGALLIAAIGAGLALSNAPPSLASLTAPLEGFDSIPPLTQIAAALGVAGFFGFAPPAIGARSVGDARRAGFAGLAFGAAGLACVAIALPYLGASAAGPSHTARALIGAASWLPALALARAGVLGAARALGLDLTGAYAGLNVLASRRIALTRFSMLVAIGIAAAAAHARVFDAAEAIGLALAIGLAFVTPALALSLIPRASSRTAAAGLVIGVVVAAALWTYARPAATPPALLNDALVVAAASFLAGSAAALLPDRAAARIRSALIDPFVDVPLDPAD